MDSTELINEYKDIIKTNKKTITRNKNVIKRYLTLINGNNDNSDMITIREGIEKSLENIEDCNNDIIDCKEHIINYSLNQF